MSRIDPSPNSTLAPSSTLMQAFFSTTDIARARALIRDLRVGYIYIGQLERTLFRAEALRKFDVLADLGDLRVVYSNPQVTIYRVVQPVDGG